MRVVALSFSGQDLDWRSISDLSEPSLKQVVVPIISLTPANGALGHGGDWRGCDCQMVASSWLLWPGSDDAMGVKLLLLSLMYLEAVGPTPSCDTLVSLQAAGLTDWVAPKPSWDTLVLLEAVVLEKRVTPLLDAVGLEGGVTPKSSCDTPVSLEAIWCEGQEAPKPTCDMFGVPLAIPDDELDMDSGLDVCVLPQPGSESLDAVTVVP